MQNKSGRLKLVATIIIGIALWALIALVAYRWVNKTFSMDTATSSTVETLVEQEPVQ
jgi:hypothetical protein